MKANRRPLLAIVVTLAMFGVACGGGEPQVENAPQPTDNTAATTTPPAETAPAATTQAPPPAEKKEAAPEKKEAAPAPKPGKERIVGKWQFDFSGEPRAAAEAEAKKKAGKDEKKLAALMKEIEEAAAGEWIEFTAPPESLYVSHVTEKGKDKVVMKVKYDVAKDENNSIVMKPSGKEEVSKKEMKDVEITVNFKDDNTIEMKDPKKNMMLTFKRKS